MQIPNHSIEILAIHFRETTILCRGQKKKKIIQVREEERKKVTEIEYRTKAFV